MKDLWKYVLAFVIGMIPVAAVWYLIFCQWLGFEMQVVAPKFGVFAAVIATSYWALYCVRGVRNYRKRLRYSMYILFGACVTVAGLCIWWIVFTGYCGWA